MAQDVYRTVIGCHSCVKNGTWLKHKRYFRLFPPTEPLEFVATNVLGCLSKTPKGNQYVVFVAERCSKLTMEIPTGQITTTNVAYLLFRICLTSYRFSSTLQLSPLCHHSAEEVHGYFIHSRTPKMHFPIHYSSIHFKHQVGLHWCTLRPRFIALYVSIARDVECSQMRSVMQAFAYQRVYWNHISFSLRHRLAHVVQFGTFAMAEYNYTWLKVSAV